MYSYDNYYVSCNLGYILHFFNKKNQIHGTFPSNDYFVPIFAVQVGGALWRVNVPRFTLKIHPGTICYKLL